MYHHPLLFACANPRDNLSVSELIPRILHERGSFLQITEASLLKEIENGDDEPAAQESDAGSAPENTLEQFQAQKQALTRHLGSALNETSLSLDFVSLLISAVKPNVARNTISPHLAKTVPLGALNSDRIEVAAAHDAGRTAAIGRGLKVDALTKATASFRGASLRLRQQVLRERLYWQDVYGVLASGEVLYKTRDPTTGHRAIGVKYGYGDSGSSYHDKGMAVLKRTSDGVALLPVLESAAGVKAADKGCKYIRVKVLSKIDDDYMLTGQLQFRADSVRPAGNVVDEIDRTRYFLFEEDLFYQLTREAKTLINYNVSIISNKIIIEVHNNIIEIEAMVYDENDDELMYQNINRESSLNNDKAQRILVFLKLMLCCFYRYNLGLRQGVPTARTKWKLHNSHPLILRPLLGYLRHEINFQNVRYILDRVVAGYDAEIEPKKYSQLLAVKDTVRVQDIFEKLTKSPLSEFAVRLRNAAGRVMHIALRLSATETFCNLIVFISITRYDSSDLAQGTKVLELQESEIYDVEECLQWVVTKFMAE